MSSIIGRKLLLAMGVLALAIPTWAGSRIEKNLALEPGGRFILESDGGSVTITGTDQSGAKVVITSDRDDLQRQFDFTFDENAGLVRVRAHQYSHWGWLRYNNLNLRFEIRVPKKTTLEVKTGGGNIEVYSLASDADVKTSAGSIHVVGLSGRLYARTSGGSVHLQEIQGNTEVQTSGGAIRAESIDGALIARTSGGPIQIERLTGRIDAGTSGGGITAVLSKKNAHGGTLKSSGGSISVAIDPTANLAIDASTSGGSVSSDLPIRVVGQISGESLYGTLGSGGETLTIRTSGGSIHIGSL